MHTNPLPKQILQQNSNALEFISVCTLVDMKYSAVVFMTFAYHNSKQL